MDRDWCVETGKCVLRGRSREEAVRIAAEICRLRGPGEAVAYQENRLDYLSWMLERWR